VCVLVCERVGVCVYVCVACVCVCMCVCVLHNCIIFTGEPVVVWFTDY